MPPRRGRMLLLAAVLAVAGLAAGAPALLESPQAATAVVGPDWGLLQSGLVFAHAHARGSRSVVVAVVDSGVNPKGLRARLVPGASFVGHGPPTDLDGHGTNVARIIAHACPRCSIMPVRVLGHGGHGSYGAIASGIRFAAAHGARIVNLSLTLDRWNADVADAVADAEHRGALVVAAAGNAGSNRRTYPAASPGVIAVAGADRDGTRASDSDYGRWVALAAPDCAPAEGTWFCGTSAAAPYVSGAAGLLLGRRPAATDAEVRWALTHTAVRRPFVAAGLLQADASLLAIGTPPPA